MAMQNYMECFYVFCKICFVMLHYRFFKNYNILCLYLEYTSFPMIFSVL